MDFDDRIIFGDDGSTGADIAWGWISSQRWDGWSVDENSVRADARQAGNQSPVIFAFIPRRNADDLRTQLIDVKAALATLDKRGVPNTPEGMEARAAMETTRQTAEGKIRELLEDAFSGVRVFQGGGNEILGNNLTDMVMEAAQNALQRLFPSFHLGDHVGWAKVLERAQKGAPDALKAVGDEGEVGKNPVCKAILGFIAGGKKGIDIRKHFEGSPYGWSGDAVDGGLMVLLVAGLIRAENELGKPQDSKELERKTIGKLTFKVESTTVTAAQRIQIRKLLQKLDVANVKSGEELAHIPSFLVAAQSLAARAGGEAPKPLPPDTQALNNIRLTAGNEQLIALYNQIDEIGPALDAWADLAERIEQRWPAWKTVRQLTHAAQGLPEAEVYTAQVNHIEEQRLLLAEPDLVPPLSQVLTQTLRGELNRLQGAYTERHQKGMAQLEADEHWQQLEPEQRHDLLAEQRLTAKDAPRVELADTAHILTTLEQLSLPAFADRVAALDGRFEAVLARATELLEPQAQFISLPRQTLKTQADIDAWLATTRNQLESALQQGPVIIG